MRGLRAVMPMLGGALALLAAAPGVGQSQESIVGTYCLTGVREVGSCFRFSEDRSFEYFLSYGAYDEASEGTWRLDGNEVVLESPAYDRAPRFAFKERRATDGDRFRIVVVTAAGRGVAGVDVRVRCEEGVHEGYTQEDGYVTPCGRAPREIALGIRMVGLAHQVVSVAEAGGEKTLVFAFEPGDLGKKPFVATRLRRDGDGLGMVYRSPAVSDLDGRAFTYRRN